MGRPWMPPAAFRSSTASVTPSFIQLPRAALVPLIAPIMAILIGSPVAALGAAVGWADAVVAAGCAGGCVGTGAVVGVAHAASSTPRTMRTNRMVRFIVNLLLVFAV